MSKRVVHTFEGASYVEERRPTHLRGACPKCGHKGSHELTHTFGDESHAMCANPRCEHVWIVKGK
jgi:hypothetical protein